jgi:hypothetical protein
MFPEPERWLVHKGASQALGSWKELVWGDSETTRGHSEPPAGLALSPCHPRVKGRLVGQEGRRRDGPSWDCQKVLSKDDRGTGLIRSRWGVTSAPRMRTRFHITLPGMSWVASSGEKRGLPWPQHVNLLLCLGQWCHHNCAA